MLSVWSISSLFDVPAQIKSLNDIYCTFHRNNHGEWHLLHVKSEDWYQRKIFENFGKIFHEIEEISRLTPWWCRHPLSHSYRMLPVAPRQAGNSVYKHNKKMSQYEAFINFEMILLTNSYHTPIFSNKHSLESQDWFPKVIK